MTVEAGGDAAPPILADLHAHFVPGVDDGAPTLDDALHYLAAEVDRGVLRVATTPHLPASRVDDSFRARAEERFAQLRQAVESELPELELRLAWELRLDGGRLDPEDRGLWLGPGAHVLVEYDRFRVPEDPLEPLRPVLDAGLVPVLAHPERYLGAEERTGWSGPLREAGVKLCLNVGSCLGTHGPGPRRVAGRLLAAGRADLVASDHHARPGRDDSVADLWGALRDAGDPAPGRRLLSENPGAVLEGRSLLPAPRVELPPVAGVVGGWRGQPGGAG